VERLALIPNPHPGLTTDPAVGFLAIDIFPGYATTVVTFGAHALERYFGRRHHVAPPLVGALWQGVKAACHWGATGLSTLRERGTY
jgi:hypothetical protein